jgi:drug/metabolite transporter (DMT)-like permease
VTASAAAQRPPSRALTALYLSAVILAWGGNWLLMKLVVADIPPLAFTALRVTGAAAVVAGVLVATGRPLLPPREERRPLAMIGLLQVAVLLGVGIFALRYATAGRAVVLTYTMQLWAIPLERWLVGDRLSRGKLIGAGVSATGLLLYLEPGLIDWTDTRALFGDALLIAGAVAWALGSCLYRRRQWRSDNWTQIAWQFAVSIPLLWLAAALTWDRSIAWSATLAGVILFNWLVPTALAYWCWARVLTAMPTAIAGQWLLLTPAFGYLASAAVFGDTVTPSMLVSVGLILVGLVVASRSPVLSRR